MDEETQNFVYVENWNDLCRLCLRNDLPLQNLFFEPSLLENTQEVTNLKFDENDALPNSVCKTCIEQVNSFVEFRLRCKTTNEWLQHEALVSDADNKVPSTIDQEVMNAKDLLVEPDQLEEQLIDNPDPIDSHQIVENEIELSDCIVQSEEDMQVSIDEVETQETTTSDHKCTVCNKELLSAYTLANHMRSHTGERPFGCRVCEKFFKTKSNLNEHYRVHNPELRWLRTSSRDIPSITRVTVTSEDLLTCTYCATVWPSLDELADHERTHSLPIVHLDEVTAEARPVDEQPVAVTFTCEQCDRVFESKAQLTAHIDDADCVATAAASDAAANAVSAAAVRQCPYCDKPFRSAATLENHKRVHTREKPFNCDVCAKPFRTKGNLLEHKRVHNSSLWLMKSDTKLQVMSDTAATATTTTAAMATAAPFDGGGTTNGAGGGADRRFQCTYCSKPFRTYTALLNHERVHTREKPFECSVCGKCFRTKSNLTEHMKGCHDIDSSACHADEVQVFTFKTHSSASAAAAAAAHHQHYPAQGTKSQGTAA